MKTDFLLMDLNPFQEPVKQATNIIFTTKIKLVHFRVIDSPNFPFALSHGHSDCQGRCLFQLTEPRAWRIQEQNVFIFEHNLASKSYVQFVKQLTMRFLTRKFRIIHRLLRKSQQALVFEVMDIFSLCCKLFCKFFLSNKNF